MIVAKRKPFEEIKEMLKPYKKVLNVGCGTCVSVCLVGGQKEVLVLNSELEIARKMEDNPIEINAVSVERQCDREFLEALDTMVDDYEAIVSMACGVGTGGICPVTMCAKGLYNGPCGGTNNGSCEINKDQPCAWYMIYERLSKQGRLENIQVLYPANDWQDQVPRTLLQPGYEKPETT